MKKAFTKGQRVWLIQSWNGKNTTSITPAIVHSCGAKRMVLTHAECGIELGRNFEPSPTQKIWAGRIEPIDIDPEPIALSVARLVRNAAIEETKRSIAASIERKTASQGWLAAKRADLAKLEASTPNFIRK